MQHSFLKGTVTVLLLLLVTSLAFGQVSVPNQITFQGRLTDGSGNPVADGPHTVNFTLWTLPVAGSNVWTENTSQTTSSGLFTHNLSSITAFSATLFENNDSLYLQIVADGQTITPRIRLTSAPYARLANNIETYGSDGAPNIETGGVSYGEIWLRDSDASNFLGVNLGAYTNGGALDLHNNVGATVISLDAGVTGDASAVLPLGAVNAGEMLNEPGVSNSINPDFFVNLASGNIDYVVDSVDITIPAAGYVVVTAGAYMNLSHTNLTKTEVYVSVDKTRANAGFSIIGSQVFRIPASQATDLWQQGCHLTRLYSESAGTHRYYLNTEYFTGTSASTNIANSYIEATYFPTLYGTVTLAEAQNGGSNLSQLSSDGSQPLSEPKLTTITVEEHNARLEAEVAKVKAELEARLQKIEQQLNKNNQAGVEE